MEAIIRDKSLAPEGEQKIAWAAGKMPVLKSLLRQYAPLRPFAGLRIGMSIHLEAKTAWLAQVLSRCGAEVFATGCNTLSTQDDVAAALAASGVNVFAKHGVTDEEYFQHLGLVADNRPNLFIDDGGDLMKVLRERKIDWDLIGGCEETTTGVQRLKRLEKSGELICPMVNVNDADCKHLFDNRYGTGQSVWTAIMAITNTLIAGKVVVVAGYGWCGKGAAMRAKALGAKVIITEIDPIKALEANMDGFEVMKMRRAVKVADYILTETGCIDVVSTKDFLHMKDGVILANGGHFDVEINMEALEMISTSAKTVRDNIREFRLTFGEDQRVNVLAQGKLVNLAGGDGHPAEIMDMSFSVQFLSLLYLAQHHRDSKEAPFESQDTERLEKRLYEVPRELDLEVARLKLASLGIEIDSLSARQKAYYYGEEAEK